MSSTENGTTRLSHKVTMSRLFIHNPLGFLLESSSSTWRALCDCRRRSTRPANTPTSGRSGRLRAREAPPERSAATGAAIYFSVPCSWRVILHPSLRAAAISCLDDTAGSLCVNEASKFDQGLSALVDAGHCYAHGWVKLAVSIDARSPGLALLRLGGLHALSCGARFRGGRRAPK